MNRNVIVITTINAPTPATIETSRLHSAWPLLVVGDVKTPNDWHLDNTRFVSIAEQRKLPFRLAGNLPENHYCRKNLGYLVAIADGATQIAETDDDNYPAEWRPSRAKETLDVEYVTDPGWVNIYRFFTSRNIWPRGFPLDAILSNRSAPAEKLQVRRVESPIQQYLASGDPDVDAVYRLTIGEIDHEYFSRSIALAPGSIVPFNSQSTVWFKSAFCYLYLPSFVSFRMTDIWRSFVAQVCLWSEGKHLTYHAPGVRQERNEHNLMRDFADEVDGYSSNRAIMEKLAALTLTGGPSEKLLICYEELIRIGIVPAREMVLVEGWTEDLEQIAKG